MAVLQIVDTDYIVDVEGYLENREQWTEDFARYCASQENIELKSGHWELIHMLQDYYEEYEFIPNIRGLSKVVAKRLSEEKSDMKYLKSLFPDSPARQAAKYSGLPKPTGCI